jgi:tetratricopeptide (TPR) repeat protein
MFIGAKSHNHHQIIDQGVAAMQARDYERARGFFLRALHDRPDSSQAWTYLALCMPDIYRQIACLRRALAFNPSNEQARTLLKKRIKANTHTPPFDPGTYCPITGEMLSEDAIPVPAFPTPVQTTARLSLVSSRQPSLVEA